MVHGTGNENLSVTSYNIQSVGKPRNKFHNLACLRKFLHIDDSNRNRPSDVICVQETFLSADIQDNQIALTGYDVYRCDDASHRAGVATYVSSTLKSKLVRVDSSIQCLIVQVTLENGVSCYVSNSYRRAGKRYRKLPEVPIMGPTTYFETLTNFLAPYANNQPCIIVGDFNSSTSENSMDNWVRKMCKKLNLLGTVDHNKVKRKLKDIDNQFYRRGCIQCHESKTIDKPWGNPSSPHPVIQNKYTIQQPDKNLLRLPKEKLELIKWALGFQLTPDNEDGLEHDIARVLFLHTFSLDLKDVVLAIERAKQIEWPDKHITKEFIVQTLRCDIKQSLDQGQKSAERDWWWCSEELCALQTFNTFNIALVDLRHYFEYKASLLDSMKYRLVEKF